MALHANLANQVIREVKKAVIGKDVCIYKTMAALLAGGHILLDDIPGVGKTTLALSFSKALGFKQNRIQFTPDVLPSDITGFSIYQKETNQFYFHPGACMCNLLLGDEINRTSPKTQSALLEVMEEGNVTVDGKTYKLPVPFHVIATQNPVGSAGTQMLPESQLDRFLICLHLGYPSIEYEIEIIKGRLNSNPLNDLHPVLTAAQLSSLQDEVQSVYVHDKIFHYIGTLINATREHEMIELGISPRGTLALTRMSQALAFLDSREYVLPSDVKNCFLDVCRHRLRLNSKARVSRLTSLEILEDILDTVPVPSMRK